MSLDEVNVVSDVLHTCTVHALTTHSEEIMGILLGDVIKTANGKSICRIWRAMPQIRTDRRKDRVEPSHKQLSDCITKADTLTKQTGTLTRVIGWYHSHPNITVQPSHVDLRTQAQHQSLDSGFVGLIISCFNGDQVIKCTAFQTVAEQAIGSDFGNSSRMSIDQEEDEDMKEAMRLSLNDYKSEQQSASQHRFRHKEIPIKIVRPGLQCEYSLMDCVNLHKTLYNEEMHTFHMSGRNQQRVSNLVRLHQSTVYYQSLLQLINGVFIPNLKALLMLGKQNEVNLEQIDKQIDHYKALFAKMQSTREEKLEDLLRLECASLPESHLDAAIRDSSINLHPNLYGMNNQFTSQITEVGAPSTGMSVQEPIPLKVNRANQSVYPYQPEDGSRTMHRPALSTSSGSQQSERRRRNPYTFTNQEAIGQEDVEEGRPGAWVGNQSPNSPLAVSSNWHIPPELGTQSFAPMGFDKYRQDTMASVPSGNQCVPFVSFSSPPVQIQRPSNNGLSDAGAVTNPQRTPVRPAVEPQPVPQRTPVPPPAEPQAVPQRTTLQPPAESQSVPQRTPLQPPAEPKPVPQRTPTRPAVDSQPVPQRTPPSGLLHSAGARRDERPPVPVQPRSGLGRTSAPAQSGFGGQVEGQNVPRMTPTDDYTVTEKVYTRRS